MKSHLTKNCFFDEEQQIARYDVVKYPQFEKLNRKQIGMFWIPEEVTLTRDGRDFKELSSHEQHVFTSNLKRQIVLDTVQGREPAKVFLPICSLPEVESFIISWTFFEQIHSRSYTHILRNIYSDPSEIFDTILDVPEIAACAKDINKYYDDLFNFPIESIYQVGFAKGNNGLAKQINSSEANTKQTAIFEYPKDNLYEYKKRLWLCLNAVNALEGIRFYASFACSWAFAEVGKMEGNAKIIKLIARDENIHLAFTQQLLKILPKEDKDFVQIQKDCEGQVRQIFSDVLKQEQDWFKYVFRDGSIIGLNETLGCTYLEWLTAKRMAAIGLKMETEITNNPLPWTQKWIAGSDVQVAPQETQITQYIQGGLKKDLEAGLSGLSLGD